MRSGGNHLDATLTVPNVLTAIRIVMALAAAVCFLSGRFEAEAVILCILAAVLDAFDGWYARTFSQCSNLGKHLDPVADKLVMAVVYGVIAVGIGTPLVWTLVGLIALREVAMTVFRSYSLRRHRKFIPANRLGKVKMITQSAIGLGVIAYAHLLGRGFDIPNTLLIPALAVILAISYLSAGVYLQAWNRAATLSATQFEAEKRTRESGRLVVGE